MEYEGAAVQMGGEDAKIIPGQDCWAAAVLSQLPLRVLRRQTSKRSTPGGLTHMAEAASRLSVRHWRQPWGAQLHKGSSGPYP
jgi:hypothetical protein